MEEKLFKKVLRDAYEREFNELTAGGEHKFSFRHRMRMRKVFRKYEMSGVDSANMAMPKTTVRRRLTVALIVVLVAAILTVTVVALVMNGFKTVEKEDHTEVFAINLENAPTTIEEVYELTWVPEGYVLEDVRPGVNIFTHHYVCGNDEIFLYQYTKHSFTDSVNTEQYPYEYININSYDAIYVITNAGSTLLWQNECYIFKVFGVLPKEDMLVLANHTKIKNNLTN